MFIHMVHGSSIHCNIFHFRLMACAFLAYAKKVFKHVFQMCRVYVRVSGPDLYHVYHSGRGVGRQKLLGAHLTIINFIS